jgi:hypothetical protein
MYMYVDVIAVCLYCRLKNRNLDSWDNPNGEAGRLSRSPSYNGAYSQVTMPFSQLINEYRLF